MPQLEIPSFRWKRHLQQRIMKECKLTVCVVLISFTSATLQLKKNPSTFFLEVSLLQTVMCPWWRRGSLSPPNWWSHCNTHPHTRLKKEIETFYPKRNVHRQHSAASRLCCLHSLIILQLPCHFRFFIIHCVPSSVLPFNNCGGKRASQRVSVPQGRRGGAGGSNQDCPHLEWLRSARV